MEKASDDEGATLDDTPPDDASEEGSEFVEVDPSGRYGRYNEVLGKGAYKTVYKAFDDLEGIEVAWNQVKIHDVLHSAGDIERLYSELHLLKTLKHKNIIKFYSSWVDTRNRNVNFITEIFTSGTLRQYRKKHKHVKLRAIKNWSRQILRGLVFLHSRDPPIIHRDLKCDNIFINGNNGEVKIGDLGLATILRQAPTAQSVIGTPEFMAPELYEEHYNELVDIYSFGMCLLEMLTSEYPYSECTNAAQIYKKVTTGKRPAALGKIKDPQTREFVEKCLASASQRLHARELLMDPFLRSDEDPEMQETSVSGGHPNFHGGVQGLDPIPENTDSRSADYFLSAQRLDEVAKRNQLRSEGSPRLDVCSSERLSVVDTMSPKEGMKSCKDFRIKGRKQDDKKVLVRIRIASSAGEVRIIQFDFDVDADTAMSVASEMVTELDLSDQDVTTIADMIDAEILALIPDWTPGLAFDDAVDIDVDKEQKGPVTDTPLVQDAQDDGLHVSTPGTMVGPLDDSQMASGPTYGRFEEVGCNVISSDQQQQESDALELFSDFSADSGSDFSLDAQSSSEIGVDNDFTIQSLDGVENEEKSGSLPSLGGRQPRVDKGKMKEEHLLCLSSDEKLDDSEVLRLIMQQQEELQLLRSKHEEAIFDLKMRLTQDATLINDSDLPKDSSLPESVGDVLQNSGSLDGFHNDANAEVCVHRAEAASCCTSILNGPPAVVDTSERISVASLSQLESASIGSIPIPNYDRGCHDRVASEMIASMLEEPLREVDQSKDLHDEEEDFRNKVPEKESKGASNNVLLVGMGSTAIFDKGAQVSRATTELVSSESRSLPPNNEGVKPGLTAITKRESYLELYKASTSKDKVSSSKSSESLGTLDGASKTSILKDANQEQLKRMADFADKLINNLSQSNNKYLGTSSVKNVTLQNGQQGATMKTHGGTSIHSSQHGVAVAKGAPGAMIQNGQQTTAVKNLASVTIQNGQQSVIAKNPPGAVVQNSTAKSLSNAVLCNGQQVASIKSTVQTSQQGTTGKSLSGVMAQNGQQSVLAQNLPGAPVQTSHQGSAAKTNTGATLQLGATAKSLTSGNGQTGQQGSTAGHPRQQTITTETTRA